jgi:hypothetical protein
MGLLSPTTPGTRSFKTVWITHGLAGLAMMAAAACDPEDDRSTCAYRSCDDGYVDPEHEGYERCVTCDADTDICFVAYYGDDGEMFASCEVRDDSCPSSGVGAYCTD